MISKTFLFILFIFFSSNVFATNIRVVDLEYLINENNFVQLLIENIEKDQIIYRQRFSEIEEKLKSELQKIEELKLILESSELDKEIDIYNQKLNKFNLEVNEFNVHYENQLNDLKNTILENLLNTLKKYSSDNKIELILDSKSYILANNSINITEIILTDLNKIDLKIRFEKFE